MRNYITGHISAYKNEILCGKNASFKGLISLIIRRWLLVVVLVAILASFGGAWAGKGQTLPAEYQPRVYLPLIIQPHAYKGLAIADMSHFDDMYTLNSSWWYDWWMKNKLMEVAG